MLEFSKYIYFSVSNRVMQEIHLALSDDGMRAVANTYFMLLLILLLIQMYKEERHFVQTGSKILNKRGGHALKVPRSRRNTAIH